MQSRGWGRSCNHAFPHLLPDARLQDLTSSLLDPISPQDLIPSVVPPSSLSVLTPSVFIRFVLRLELHPKVLAPILKPAKEKSRLKIRQPTAMVIRKSESRSSLPEANGAYIISTRPAIQTPRKEPTIKQITDKAKGKSRDLIIPARTKYFRLCIFRHPECGCGQSRSRG